MKSTRIIKPKQNNQSEGISQQEIARKERPGRETDHEDEWTYSDE